MCHKVGDILLIENDLFVIIKRNAFIAFASSGEKLITIVNRCENG